MPGPALPAKRSARFSVSLRCREAHALDGRKGDATDLDRHSLGGSGAEDGDALGPGVAEGRPACLDRVVIAVNDEAGDARVRQALKAVTEAQLCP